MATMAAGKTKLMSLAEAAFDAIEQDSPDDATLGVVMIVAEVRMRNPDQTAIFEFSSDRRTWVQKAILSEALESIGLGITEMDT